MKAISPVFARELAGFARSPLTYLIAAALGLAAGVLALPPHGESGGVLRDGAGYVRWWPWLLAGLGAAFGARVWARESRTGSLWVILSQPTPLWHLAGAKIAAAWLAALCASGVVFAPAISAAVLGRLEFGELLCAMLSAALLLGAYTALGTAASAAARDEAGAFALALVGTLGLVALTDPPAAAPAWIESVAQLSPVASFTAARQGVIELVGLVQSLAVLVLCGGLSIIALEARRAG